MSILKVKLVVDLKAIEDSLIDVTNFFKLMRIKELLATVNAQSNIDLREPWSDYFRQQQVVKVQVPEKRVSAGFRCFRCKCKSKDPFQFNF